MKNNWQTKKLGEVCAFLNRGISPRYVEDGGICVLNQKCIRNHSVSFEPARRHNTDEKKVGNERLVQIGDVLVNSTGTGTLGLVTKKSDVPWTNEFFFHVFNTKPVRKAIHASASGVKVRHTSPAKIGEAVVAFPTSLTEQRSIVSALTALTEQTQHLESLYQQKIAALDELKKSILHQAFSGEL